MTIESEGIESDEDDLDISMISDEQQIDERINNNMEQRFGHKIQ